MSSDMGLVALSSSIQPSHDLERTVSTRRGPEIEHAHSEDLVIRRSGRRSRRSRDDVGQYLPIGSARKFAKHEFFFPLASVDLV